MILFSINLNNNNVLNIYLNLNKYFHHIYYPGKASHFLRSSYFIGVPSNVNAISWGDSNLDFLTNYLTKSLNNLSLFNLLINFNLFKLFFFSISNTYISLSILSILFYLKFLLFSYFSIYSDKKSSVVLFG